LKLRRALALLVIVLMTVGLVVGLVLMDTESDEERLSGLVDGYLEALDTRDWQAIYDMQYPKQREPSLERAQQEIEEEIDNAVRTSCGPAGLSSEVTFGWTDVRIQIDEPDDFAVASWRATCNGETAGVSAALRFVKVGGRWYLVQ
jgi:hypothetical protein